MADGISCSGVPARDINERESICIWTLNLSPPGPGDLDDLDDGPGDLDDLDDGAIDRRVLVGVAPVLGQHLLQLLEPGDGGDDAGHHGLLVTSVVGADIHLGLTTPPSSPTAAISSASSLTPSSTSSPAGSASEFVGGSEGRSWRAWGHRPCTCTCLTIIKISVWKSPNLISSMNLRLSISVNP